MTGPAETYDDIRAALAPHGLFLRGRIACGPAGPALDDGSVARSVLLVGQIGGSLWRSFSAWRAAQPDRGGDHPLDTWSETIIRPLAAKFGATVYFPSQKPWQPFQQWAMAAEGLRASPLGILIHPVYGLWHGYRAALGFAEDLGDPLPRSDMHPCSRCADKPCLTTCPVGAVFADRFDVGACRTHLKTDSGRDGCMLSGCLARNACPVGHDYRYGRPQLQFHMNALG